MGGSTTVQAPSATDTAQQALQAQVDIAPQQYQATAQYAPQYSDLYSNIAQSSLFGDANSSGLLSTYAQAAPQLQNIQSGVNAQQAQANISLVQQLGSSALQTYQQANPQLEQLQNQLTSLAGTPQNPVSQLQVGGQSGVGSWVQPYSNQVSQTVGGNQVQGANLGYNIRAPQQVGAGYNSTVGQLNQTAQQQLAMGTSVSPQEASTVSNEVLSNYNSMGRANDPTAIAGLATGLDTYGQQLLNQRESNAATAGGLQTGQQQLGLSAGQSNQSAGIAAQQLGLNAASTQAGLTQQANLANQANATQGLGLIGAAQGTAGQQQLAGGQANQQAQLQNAQYQANLLTTGANLAQSSAVNPYQLILGQSGALGAAAGATTQAEGSANAGNQLANMYNPFTNGAFNTVYGGQLTSNQDTASNNAAITGASIGAAGNIISSL